MLTQKRLKEVLDYDAETGSFTRKINIGKRYKAGEIAGTINHHGYRVIMVDGQQYQSHRLAFLYINEEFPKNSIDHINQIKTDNRISNLRSVKHQENCKNQPIRSNNTSGVTGVCYNKKSNKWQAQIKLTDKQLNLGSFTNKDEAIKVRQEAEVKFGYYPNHGKQL